MLKKITKLIFLIITLTIMGCGISSRSVIIDGVEYMELVKKYENGNIEFVGHMRNQALNGPVTYYFENGVIRAKGEFLNGQRQLVWVWNYENGQKKNEYFYINDLAEGEWRKYYEYGTIKIIGIYENGKKNGLEK